MKKVLWRVFVAFGAVLILALGLSYFIVSRSLPQLDGTISVAGVGDDVTIVRDKNGVPTITGTDRIDVAFATGFAHSQDRYFQMDLSRRNAAGELSELFGSIAVDLDKRNRFHRFRTRAAAIVESFTSSEKAILSAYTAGANAGLLSLKS